MNIYSGISFFLAILSAVLIFLMWLVGYSGSLGYAIQESLPNLSIWTFFALPIVVCVPVGFILAVIGFLKNRREVREGLIGQSSFLIPLAPMFIFGGAIIVIILFLFALSGTTG